MSNTKSNNKSFSDDLGLVSQNNLSPADFDKQLRADLKRIFPASGAARAPAASTERAARAAGCPILDTPTLPASKTVPRKSCSFKWLKDARSRRIFSRVMAGMNLPGRYYFLTLTSSPESPPLKNSFKKLCMWMKKERPGISHIHVITDEGFGVVHMVFRLPLRSKNIEVRKLRAWWVKWHKAKQIKILRASSDHEKLADYLCDQRKMRKLGSEMSWQDTIVSWDYSKGWLPKGYARELRRLWFNWIDAPEELRKKVVRESINIAAVREKKELMKNDGN